MKKATTARFRAERPTMLAMLEDILARPRTKRLVCYFAKVIVLMGLLCLTAWLSPFMPAACVALFWALISAISTMGPAYYAVIRKTHNRSKYERGGALYRINEGRTASLVVSFAVSAVCVAGLMLEAPKWDAVEWLLVAASAPLFAAVMAVASKRLDKEYAVPFRTANAVKWSCVIVAVLLCAAYAAISLLQPATHYASATEAFLAAPRPFESSPSALMSEAGTLASFVDGLTAYGMSEASVAAFPLYIAWRIALVASAFFGIANLLGLCAIERRELKRVFSPLEAADRLSPHAGAVRRYAAISLALPLCLALAFMAADAKAAAIANTGEYSAAEDFVREQVGIAAFVLDGKYYDYQAVEGLIDDIRGKSAALSEEAKETLVPMVNASYDKRIENVDSYLDWYYSLPADYERLANMVAGTAEDFISEQFEAKIEEGIDDSAIAEQLSDLSAQAERLKADAEETLSAYELDKVPDWLVATVATLDANFLSEPMEPTQKLMDATARIGVSAGGGLAAGVLAKAATKSFFGKFVGKIGGALGSRAAGAAAGGIAGTLAGPLGTIAGIAAGTALGVGVDAVLLNIDEMQNREGYKAEIIDAIEEERAATLAALG